MSLDDIDIDSWGKIEEKKEEKKPRPPRETTPKPKRRETKPRSTTTHVPRWELKAKTNIPIDKIPIDALRGIYYFCFNKVDKKYNKMELKRVLKEVLSNQDSFNKLIQSIIDITFSD
ncbi:MAG: hypothetical protein ACFFCS_03400 [Candidatus Hodarchaeota archaeon]